MKWKHSLSFGCFSICQQRSLHLILLSFLSQVKFSSFIPFPFYLLNCFSVFILLLSNFYFLAKILNNIFFFWFFSVSSILPSSVAKSIHIFCNLSKTNTLSYELP